MREWIVCIMLWDDNDVLLNSRLLCFLNFNNVVKKEQIGQKEVVKGMWCCYIKRAPKDLVCILLHNLIWLTKSSNFLLSATCGKRKSFHLI